MSASHLRAKLQRKLSLNLAAEIAVVVFALVASVFGPQRLAAHGAAAWIMADPAIRHCCGPHDCRALPAGAARALAPGVWELPSLGVIVRQGDPGLFPSIDDHWWVCVRPDGTLRCLFRPVPAA